MIENQWGESAIWYRSPITRYIPTEKVEPGVFSSERVVSVRGLEGVFSGLFDEKSISNGKLEVLVYAQNRDGTVFLVRPLSGEFFQGAALSVPKESGEENPLKERSRTVQQ